MERFEPQVKVDVNSNQTFSIKHISGVDGIPPWFVREGLTGPLLDVETRSPSGRPLHNRVAVFAVQPGPFLARDTTSPSDQCLLGLFRLTLFSPRAVENKFPSILAQKIAQKNQPAMDPITDSQYIHPIPTQQISGLSCKLHVVKTYKRRPGQTGR